MNVPKSQYVRFSPSSRSANMSRKQHQVWLNAANSPVDPQDGGMREPWCSLKASLPSDCLPPLLNSAVFIWRLYGSVTGTLPTISVNTKHSSAVFHQHRRTQAHAANCRPFWISFCLTGGILCAALSDGLCLVCVLACARLFVDNRLCVCAFKFRRWIRR